MLYLCACTVDVNQHDLCSVRANAHGGRLRGETEVTSVNHSGQHLIDGQYRKHEIF